MSTVGVAHAWPALSLLCRRFARKWVLGRAMFRRRWWLRSRFARPRRQQADRVGTSKIRFAPNIRARTTECPPNLNIEHQCRANFRPMTCRAVHGGRRSSTTRHTPKTDVPSTLFRRPRGQTPTPLEPIGNASGAGAACGARKRRCPARRRL